MARRPKAEVVEGFERTTDGLVVDKAASKDAASQSAITVTAMANTPRAGSAELIAAWKLSPWLRAVTDKIGKKIAAVEWKLYARGKGEARALPVGRVTRASAEVRRGALLSWRRKGELVEVEDHLALDFLTSANPHMSGNQARRVSQIHLEIAGEAFWALTLNGAGKPVMYWPLPPHWVTRTPDGRTPGQGFEITVSGRRATLPAENVVWFREIDPSDPYGRGSGVGESLGDELSTDENAARFLKAFFLNNARPDLLISVEGAEQAELERAAQKFDAGHRGSGRAHRPFWHSGGMTVKELQGSLQSMTITELRQWSRDLIIAVWGVPPEVMGINENSNRATSHEAERIMADSVLVPRLEALRETLQTKVVDLFDPRLVLDYVSPHPDDAAFRKEVLTVAPWAATVREWRELGGLEDRGEQDEVHLVPPTLVPVAASSIGDFEAFLPTPAVPSAPAAAPAPEVETEDDEEDEVEEALDAEAVSAALSEERTKGVPRLVHRETNTMIVRVLAALVPDRLRSELDPIWKRRIEAWGDAALMEVGSQASFNMQNPFVVEHLRDFSSGRITDVNETTKARVADVLADGFREGEGVNDLAARIRGVMGEASTYRSKLIARTESVRSSSFASNQAYSMSGLVEGKEWIVTPDGERHDSQGFGGALAKVAQDFDFGEWGKAPYPGGFNDPAQDCNCRCAVAPVADLNEGKALDKDEAALVWRGLDARRTVWERETVKALRRAFAEQEREAIDALRRAMLP